MHDYLDAQITGNWMEPDEYFEDFQREFWTDNAGTSWKFERRQEFVEPGDASWEASHADNWDESIKILESRRASIREYEQKLTRGGLEVRRARVVEKPISKYLIWELSSLNIRSQFGGKIRIVSKGQIKDFERNHILPELFLVGTKAVYEVVYDDSGAFMGAVKSANKEIVGQWAEFVADIYDQGEEIASYYQREVARLVPRSS